MNKFFRIALVIALACLVSPINGQAAQSGDTISVTVTGMGADADAALRNALRAAVEQAVGSLVGTETLVRNDEVISDRILSVSGGFVQTYRELGEPRVINGLVSIRITADVKRNELNTHLQRAGVTREQVDWERFFTERLSKMQSREDGLDMIKWMIEEQLMNCISVSKAAEPRFDTNRNKVVLEILTTIDYAKYDVFVRRFAEVLQKMEVRYEGEQTLHLTRRPSVEWRFMWSRVPIHQDTRPVATIIQDNRLMSSGHVWYNPLFLIASNRWRALPNEGLRQENFSVFSPSREVYDEVRNNLLTIKSKSIIIELLDDENRTVATNRVLSCGPFYVDRSRNHASILFFPLLFRDGFSEVNYHIWPGTLEHREEIYFDVPMGAVERIRSVQFRFE